jgi:hypothetical protein
VFLKTQEPADFAQIKKATYLDSSFSVNEECFKKLPKNSFVVMDDFSFVSPSKQIKIDFLKVINFYLRHNKITLILVIHNLYNTSLSNEIFLSPHIILAYSNLGFSIMR